MKSSRINSDEKTRSDSKENSHKKATFTVFNRHSLNKKQEYVENLGIGKLKVRNWTAEHQQFNQSIVFLNAYVFVFKKQNV